MSILPVVAYCATCQESRDALLVDGEGDLDQSDPCGTTCPVCRCALQTGYECPDCGVIYEDEDDAIHCCNWDCSREGYRLIYAALNAAGQLQLRLPAPRT
jgi:hypothetical protein